MKKNFFFYFIILYIIFPSLVFASFDISLKYGSKGIAVSELQTFLQSQNVFSEKVDGKFGPITLNAVKIFQSKNNLSPDGNFGKLTRAKAILLTLNQSQSTNTTKQTETVVSNIDSVVPFKGTLNLSKNTSYENQSFIAPKSKTKLADFSLTNKTTEIINLNKIQADLMIGSDSSIVNLYISNLYVAYENNTTFLNSATENNYWPINFDLPVGQTINLSLYGDVSSYIPLNSVISSKILVSGVSAISATNVYSNSNAVLSGQNIKFTKRSLDIVKDSLTPASKIYVVNQKIIAGEFKFTAMADSYTLSQLKFIIPSLKDSSFISNITLVDTATQATLATVQMNNNYYNTNVSIFDFNIDIPISVNSSKSIKITYDLNKNINSNSTNINIAPVLVYVKATDSMGAMHDGIANDYSNFVNSSFGGIALPTTGVTVNNLRVFKSIPTLTAIPLTNKNIPNGTNADIYKFSITADLNGDVSVRQLIFLITLNDPNKSNFSLNSFSFLKNDINYTSSVAIGNLINNSFTELTGTNGIMVGIENTVIVSFYKEEIIPAGKTQTYTLKANINNLGLFSKPGSVTVRVASDVNKINGGGYLKTIFYNSFYGLSETNTYSSVVNHSNLLWSDVSENFFDQRNLFDNYSTGDWYNGFGILNLPLSSQTINVTK